LRQYKWRYAEVCKSYALNKARKDLRMCELVREVLHVLCYLATYKLLDTKY